MTREETQKIINHVPNKYILLQLPTGYGKSKIALDRAFMHNLNAKILIVIPKLVLEDNWNDEFELWGYSNENVVYSTYLSLDKHLDEHFDTIIFDEGHHITDRCADIIERMSFDEVIILSATVKKDVMNRIRCIFPHIYIHKVSVRKAIENDILPDPKVILLALQLDDNEKTESYKKKNIIYKVTKAQYYRHMSCVVENMKTLAMTGSMTMKRMWLTKAGQRLKWLSSQKTDIVQEILNKLKRRRTLTFCNSINQAECLAKYAIHSKNPESDSILEMFNNNKIKHISSVNILDEGVNLKNCQVGIFANLNSSDRMIKQRLGRLLRHKKPYIIIPYFVGTRDEEIVSNMLLDYNPDLVSKIYKIEDLKL